MTKLSPIHPFRAAFRAFAGALVQRGYLPFNFVPVDTGGYGESLTSPFRNSVWVQRAIKKISGPISSISLYFENPETDEEFTDPQLDAFWSEPVAGMDRSDFVEACVGWLKLCGEIFILLPPDLSVPFPEARTAWPKLRLARPDQMRAKKASDGSLAAWVWQNGPKTERLAPDQVVQIKYWNPYNELRGISEYEAAQVASEADYLAGKFALNLSRANGDTGLIVAVADGSVLDEAQRLQITNALREKRAKSLRGEFASMFLPASLKVEDPKIQSIDANFAAQRIGNRHEIAIAFGVPPSMFDVKASYSIGADSDYHQLIIDTCQPTGGKIASAISIISSRMRGRPVKACLDWDEHPTMQIVRQARIDSATKLFDRGLPWREVSDYLDLDLPSFDGDDIGYIPFGLQPVDKAAAEPPIEANPAFAESDQPAETPLEKIRRAFRNHSHPCATARSAAPGMLCQCHLADVEIRATDTADEKHWKGIVAKRRAAIAAFKSKFSRVIFQARSETVGKLKAAATKSPITRAGAAADFMFSLREFEKSFSVGMRAVAKATLQLAADQLRAETKLDDPWQVPDPRVQAFLTTRENKLKNVPMDIFERIRKEIQSGLDAGDPLGKIAKQVSGAFDDISAKRGAVIAHTETATAYGVGRHEAMVGAGIQWKRWLTSNNNNVRLAHRQMQGEIIAVDDYFRVVNPETGEADEVLHPADPGGAPWNVINCHCVELASATGPEGVVEPALV